MSWQCTSWAVKQRCGDALTKYTLLTYGQYADGVGAVYWPQLKIAREMEIGEDAVRRRLNRLQELKLIARFKTRSESGAYSVDLVVLLFDKVATEYVEFLEAISEPADSGGKRTDGSRGVFPTVNLAVALDYDRPDRKRGVSRGELDGGIPRRAGSLPAPRAGTHPALEREQEKDHLQVSFKTCVPPRDDEASGRAEGQQGKDEADAALRSRCLEVCRTDKTERTFVDFGTEAFRAWSRTYARLNLTGPAYSKRMIFDGSTKTVAARTGSYFPSEFPPDHTSDAEGAA